MWLLKTSTPLTLFVALISIVLYLSNNIAVRASPTPVPAGDWVAGSSSSNNCRKTTSYNVTSQTEIKDSPKLVTGIHCNATFSGCSISNTDGYSVSVTASVGGLTDADKLASKLTIVAEVGFTTTKASDVYESVLCPPGFLCGLQAIATLWNVTGWKTTSCGTSGCRCDPVYDRLEIHYPAVVPGAAKNAGARVEFGVCIISGSVNAYQKPDSIPTCPGYPAPQDPTNIDTPPQYPYPGILSGLPSLPTGYAVPTVAVY